MPPSGLFFSRQSGAPPPFAPTTKVEESKVDEGGRKEFSLLFSSFNSISFVVVKSGGCR